MGTVESGREVLRVLGERVVRADKKSQNAWRHLPPSPQEGHRLIRAFLAVKNPEVREAILRAVEDLEGARRVVHQD